MFSFKEGKNRGGGCLSIIQVLALPFLGEIKLILLCNSVSKDFTKFLFLMVHYFRFVLIVVFCWDFDEITSLFYDLFFFFLSFHFHLENNIKLKLIVFFYVFWWMLIFISNDDIPDNRCLLPFCLAFQKSIFILWKSFPYFLVEDNLVCILGYISFSCFIIVEDRSQHSSKAKSSSKYVSLYSSPYDISLHSYDLGRRWWWRV